MNCLLLGPKIATTAGRLSSVKCVPPPTRSSIHRPAHASLPCVTHVRCHSSLLHLGFTTQPTAAGDGNERGGQTNESSAAVCLSVCLSVVRRRQATGAKKRKADKRLNCACMASIARRTHNTDESMVVVIHQHETRERWTTDGRMVDGWVTASPKKDETTV